MHFLSESSEILDLSEEVGILDDKHRCVLVQHIDQVFERGTPTFIADKASLRSLMIGTRHGAVVWMDIRAEDHLAAFAPPVRNGNCHCFGKTGRAVVMPSVRGFHPAQHFTHTL